MPQKNLDEIDLSIPFEYLFSHPTPGWLVGSKPRGLGVYVPQRALIGDFKVLYLGFLFMPSFLASFAFFFWYSFTFHSIFKTTDGIFRFCSSSKYTNANPAGKN